MSRVTPDSKPGTPQAGLEARRGRMIPGAPTSAVNGRGLRTLSIATVAAIPIALALVFFYAPIEAEEGFLQKIFYLHVPLAIVSLCGFVLGGMLAIAHLRTRDRRWDLRSYVTIHMSLIFGVRR